MKMSAGLEEEMQKRRRLEATRRLLGVKRSGGSSTAGNRDGDGKIVDKNDRFDDDDGVDPLDAYMAKEVNPEVTKRAYEEARADAQRRALRAMEMADARARGVEVKKRADARAIEEEEEKASVEDTPDEVIEVPNNKVKLIIGAGGENVKALQKKSGARIQVLKSEEALNAGFGGMDFNAATIAARVVTQKLLDSITSNVIGMDAAESDDDSDDDVLRPKSKANDNEKKNASAPIATTKIMINGTPEAREACKRMITELFERAAQERRDRRADDRERLKEKRARDRRLYHLRHAADYERLELPIGATKEEIKAAFKKLAVKWHPDKHPAGERRETAKARFEDIRVSYEKLMTSEEEHVSLQRIAANQSQSRSVRRPLTDAELKASMGVKSQVQDAIRTAAAAQEAAFAREAYKRL
jgi:hypothetical protein